MTMHEKDTGEEINTGVLSRPILVPLDGTDVTEGILPYVTQFAKGANVPLVLHGVVDPGAIDYPTSFDFSDPSSRPESGSMAYANEILKKIARRLHDEGLPQRL